MNDVCRAQDLVAVEVAVPAAGDRDQAVGCADAIQRRVKPRRLRERHDRIGVAVQREHGRRALGDVGQRRETSGDSGGSFSRKAQKGTAMQQSETKDIRAQNCGSQHFHPMPPLAGGEGNGKRTKIESDLWFLYSTSAAASAVCKAGSQ